MKKIILVHYKYPYGKEENGIDYCYNHAYPNAFYANGYQVNHFYLEGYKSSEFENDHLIKFARKINPEIVFFNLLNNEVSDNILEYLKNKHVTVNWFGDDEWRFEVFSSKKCHFFSFSITTDRYALIKYRMLGYHNIILSQWSGIDSLKNENLKFDNFKYDVSFVGMANTYRRWVIKFLKKSGINVHVFGPGWGTDVPDYENMANIFFESKISINLENSVSYDLRYLFFSIKAIAHTIFVKKNSNQIKARTFEVPFYGGFLITNYCPDLGLYFDIDRNIVCYNNIDDLIKLIKTYLSDDYFEEYKRIKIHSNLNVIRNHSFNMRIRDILNHITS